MGYPIGTRCDLCYYFIDDKVFMVINVTLIK